MKKLKIFAVLLFLICTISAFAACGGKLDAPKGLTVTEENEVTWSPVKDAYRYLVQFKDVDNGEEHELKTKEAKISVAEFELEEGWYDVRVKALSGEDEENDSVWSAAFEYYKIYESGCTFTLVNNVEYHVTGSAKAKGDVEIESTYNDKPVTRIAESAFKSNTRITSVKFGEYVEAIDKNAFSGCSLLQSVTLPEGLKTIGENAFQNCRELTGIEIPDQVTVIDKMAFGNCRKLGTGTVSFGKSLQTINENAFFGCSTLKKVEIPDSVQYIGERAFSNCTAIESVSIGSGVIQIAPRAFYENTALGEITFNQENSKLETIGNLAFAYAVEVKELKIPDGTVYLGDGAFQGCEKLYSIDIPDTIEYIGAYTFGKTKYYIDWVDTDETLCYLENWLIAAEGDEDEEDVDGTDEDDTDEDDTDEVDNSFKGTVKNITPDMFKAGLVGIANAVFERCPNLETVELPYTVKYICDYAFYKCTTLNNVTVYEAETVGAYAFADDTNLSQLSLGNKLKTIGAYAFQNCICLQNNSQFPIVPDTVTRIGQNAFKNSGLWSKPEDGLIYAGSWVVGYDFKAAAPTVTVKAGTVGIADYAFYMASSLETISGLATGVKYIGRGAFFGCAKLGMISLYDGMEKIEDYTFYGCTNLLDVSFPTDLKKIGRSAFYGCTILSYVDFSQLTQLEEIGIFAFFECRNLTSVDFGWTLETIGDGAFYKCYSLEKVELPDTVKKIGSYAFYNNYFSYENDSGELVKRGLKEIVFDKDPTDKFASQLETIGDYAFTGCQLLESVELPDSLVSIGTSAFYNCFAVESVSLGANLEKIGDYAFYGLDKVTELELPETVKSIGRYAFKGWEGITSVVISSNVQFVDEHAFYGCKNATIYTELSPDEANWNLRWNSSYRPVVFGATLSEDKTYVVSLTVAEDTFANLRAEGGVGSPMRAGYEFKGWYVSANFEGSPVTEITELPVGTTLYAKWAEIVETVEPME